MESDEITWNVVPNTVANRMIDLSLLHKLVPCRRLRRRNKAMNAAIKQYQSIRTYSQYVKMKTSVLRNVTDDSETDCNDTFTEDDYSILYKSDVSLANYIKETLKKNRSYSYEIESETNGDHFMSNVKSRKTVIKKSKSTPPINLGWQNVKRRSQKASLKKRIEANKFTCDNDDTKETFSIMNDNVQNNIQSKTNTPHKYFINYIKENALNLEDQVSVKDEINTATVEDVCDTASDSTEITCNSTAVQNVTNNNDKLEQSDPTVSNISKEFQSGKNYCYKMFGNSNIRTPKRSFSLHNDTNRENMSVDQNCPNQVEKDLNITKTLMNMPLVIGNTYQLKDSGIDEDTEEEILEHGKKLYKTFKNGTQKEEEEDTSNTSSIVNSKNNLIDSDDNLKFNTSKDIMLLVNENIDKNQVKCKQKMQTDKLQPKVTHTEVVNKKYKIMCDISVLDENVESEELSINDFCDEKSEVKKIKLIMENSTSPITEKRYQQLRRLNLVDSDSSISDNDDRNCNIENMRDKLFRRSSEFSDNVLSNENDNVNPNHEISIQLHKKVQKNEDFSEQTSYCLDDEDNILKKCSNINEDSSPDTKQLSFASNKSVQNKSDLNCAISRNFDEEKLTKDSSEKDLKIENMMQCEKKESTCRPYNLQEFIEKENLLVETTKPSFTLKDIEEDDEVFIMDIPSMLLENQLEGNKIAFREKTLKLGKQKYKVEYKDIDNVSCFLGTKKRKKPYKIVNIKPMARIVVREKVTKNLHEKFSNQCSNHNIDCSDEIKDEVISRKRHSQTEQNLLFKKRCLNID